MGSIKAVLAHNLTDYDTTLGCLLPGLLWLPRCGEFIDPSQEAYDSDMHLDIALDDPHMYRC